MEIDRKTLKALAADTRLDILQSLSKRRKMPSELSKELKLAASTVTEHLDRLEDAGLIRREETGHKWIYYDLTSKGENLIRPKVPMQFVLVLSLSILVISAAFIYSTYFSGWNAGDFSAPTTMKDAGALAQTRITGEVTSSTAATGGIPDNSSDMANVTDQANSTEGLQPGNFTR